MAKRQVIWDKVIARLATITTGNGYQTNVGADIRQWQLTPLESTDIDCLCVSDPTESGDDGQDKNSAMFTRYLEINIKAFLAESTASPEKARKVECDLIKCVGVDEKWDGLARRTSLETSEIAVDEKGARIGGLDFTMKIEFSRKRWES